MALTKISTAMISQSAAAVDLNVDAGTFYVDTTNNRVGVGGKTDPDTPLHVVGTVTATLFAGSGASLTNIPNGALTNSSITINSTAVSLGGSLTLDTDDVAEGSSNLYYTNARADARIAAADTDDLSEGSSNLYYTDARVDARVSGGSLGNITTTGYIRGPATFTIDPAAHGDNSGTVVIAGNLQVDGTTTTINSTTMTVDDKNITLASGSANAAAADGAGFTVDVGSGTNPTLVYNGSLDTWDSNKLFISDSGGVDRAQFRANYGSGNYLDIKHNLLNAVTSGGQSFVIQYGGTTALTIDSSRNTALAGNLDVTGIITGDDGLSIQGGTGNAYLQVGSDTGSWTWKNYRATHKLALEDSDGTGEVLNFDTSGNATFAGTISSGAITSSGNIFMSTNGSILRNSGGALQLQSDSSQVILRSNNTTALTLDTSQNATFAGNVTLSSTGVVTLKAAPLGSTYGAGFNVMTVTGTSSSPYTSTIGFSNYGVTNAMVIQGGNVGIGTPSPTYKLHVQSADANDDVAYIHHDNAAQSSGTLLKVRTDAGDSNGYTLLDVQTNSGSALFVRGDRKVGIGTESPLEKLDVNSYTGISVNNNYAHMGSTVSGAMAIFGHNIKSDSANNTIKSANTGLSQ